MLNKQPNRVQYKGFLSDNQKSAIINGYFVANSQQIGKKNVRSSKTKISFLRNESYIFLDNRETTMSGYSRSHVLDTFRYPTSLCSYNSVKPSGGFASKVSIFLWVYY